MEHTFPRGAGGTSCRRGGTLQGLGSGSRRRALALRVKVSGIETGQPKLPKDFAAEHWSPASSSSKLSRLFPAWVRATRLARQAQAGARGDGTEDLEDEGGADQK